MTNEITNQESGQVTDNLSDPELELLLGDAWESPPLPVSLLTRIDRGITAEWGHSPQLADSRRNRWSQSGARIASRSWTVLRSLPVAGALTMIVVLAVLFSSNSRSYAWSTVMDALARHGLIEIQDGEETRWLSLSEGMSGVRTPDRSRLIDLNENIVLERVTGSPTVLRRQIAPVDRNTAVLQFLLGDTSFSTESGTSRLRIINEEWKAAGNDDPISLNIAVDGAGAPFIVRLLLDPESGMPQSVQSGEARSQKIELDPTTQTAQKRRADEFPVMLTFVDATDDVSDETSVANGTDPLTSADKPEAPAADLVATNTSSDSDTVAEAAEPPMFGAPAHWKSVRPIRSSAGDVVQQADAMLTQLWNEKQIVPAEPADDTELLRRVYLDLIG
ncbi:MAG: hypothetical protein KDA85_16390, partial [Planctomycetaceae bacterium]|nr:hypothetical protein [Planctomycetaceae bacterium]